MKRGKRQVVQRKNQTEAQETNIYQNPNNYFQNISNIQSNTISHSQHQNRQPARIVQNNQQSNLISNNHYISPAQRHQQIKKTQQKIFAPSPVQNPQMEKLKEDNNPKIQQMDQKKRKIQLLKQKYLKKNKPEQPQKNSISTNQNNSENAKNSPISTNNTSLGQVSTVQEIPNKNTTSQNKNNLPHVNSSSFQSNSNKSSNLSENNYKQPNTKKQQQSLQQTKKLQQNYEQQQKQVTKQAHQPPPVPVTNKVGSRNPPPPPSIKKNTPPPPIKHQMPPPLKSNIQPLVEQNEENPTQNYLHEHNSVFDTHSQNNSIHHNRVQQQKPIQALNVPAKKPTNPSIPPPPNRNMKDILTKKLNSNKQIPKPPVVGPKNVSKINQFQQDTTKQQQTVGKYLEVNQNHKPVIKSTSSLSKSPRSMNGKSNINYQIDEQYSNPTDSIKQVKQKNTPLNKHKQHNHINEDNIDPYPFISQWMTNPQITLKQLFPSLQQTIGFFCLGKHIPLNIASTNSSFNQLTAQFIQSFIINNTTKLTPQQKNVTQTIGLKFFYNSATQMNDIFLVLLIKMGKQYLEKYYAVLQEKLDIYLKKLVLLKNLLLNQQLDNFVNFCLEKNLINQTNYLKFMMLSGQNTQLISLISNKQIQNLRYAIGLLSFCKLNLKSKPTLMGLYLKMIFNLAPHFSQEGLVEKILNHMKQIQIPENLYQFSKQLKLRLLKNYDTDNKGQQKYNKNESTTNNQPNEKQEKGLFGYFNNLNINKAIDKIKTTTQKALGAVQKQTKPQEQQKKDQIVYDPIKKRYVINGQIPQDEDSPKQNNSQEPKQKTPPPPPLGGVKKAPPPPPVHGKKPAARIAVNRYV